MTGQRFGRLVVLERADALSTKNAHWLCRCDCGELAVASRPNLRSGSNTSCGCRREEERRSRPRKHGHVEHGRTRTYVTWAGMVQRCTNKKATHFRDYGGRGIEVCGRWLTFENFLADMGERPADLALDRINVNGNYEPSNCRWADAITQANNKRRNLGVAI